MPGSDRNSCLAELVSQRIGSLRQVFRPLGQQRALAPRQRYPISAASCESRKFALESADEHALRATPARSCGAEDATSPGDHRPFEEPGDILFADPPGGELGHAASPRVPSEQEPFPTPARNSLRPVAHAEPPLEMRYVHYFIENEHSDIDNMNSLRYTCLVRGVHSTR